MLKSIYRNDSFQRKQGHLSNDLWFYYFHSSSQFFGASWATIQHQPVRGFNFNPVRKRCQQSSWNFWESHLPEVIWKNQNLPPFLSLPPQWDLEKNISAKKTKAISWIHFPITPPEVFTASLLLKNHGTGRWNLSLLGIGHFSGAFAVDGRNPANQLRLVV